MMIGHAGAIRLVPEALAASSGLARLGLVLRSLPGRGRGDPAFAAAQTVELLQRFYDPKTGHIDMREFTRNVEAETRVAVGIGGRVTPEQYRAYAKQSRVAGMSADDQFLYQDLPAVLIALGGSRAGTAHAAVYQQLLTGRMIADPDGSHDFEGGEGSQWAERVVRSLLRLHGEAI
jgi:hypothetical protein